MGKYLMVRLCFSSLIVCGQIVVNCTAKQSSIVDKPNWKQMESKFKYFNKKEFYIDTSFFENKDSLVEINSFYLNSWFGTDRIYLYSWLKSDRFTLLVNNKELGDKIYYVVTNTQSEIISTILLARRSMEVYDLFEIGSKIISPDSVVITRSITTLPHSGPHSYSQMPSGDTTKSVCVIYSDGSIMEKVLTKVNRR
jgi:hypothetical protein